MLFPKKLPYKLQYSIQFSITETFHTTNAEISMRFHFPAYFGY